MTSQKEKTEATKRKLLESGAELLLEQGCERSTVNAILARAGLSKGAFYHNYSSKDDLFWELLQDKAARVREGFWDEANGSQDVMSPTEYMVRSSLTLSLDPVFKTIYSYYQSKSSHNAEAKQRLKAIHELRLGLAVESIGNAQQNGYIPKHIDLVELSTFILSISIGLGMQLSTDPNEFSFERYVRLYQKVVLSMFEGRGFPENQVE